MKYEITVVQEWPEGQSVTFDVITEAGNLDAAFDQVESLINENCTMVNGQKID